MRGPKETSVVHTAYLADVEMEIHAPSALILKSELIRKTRSLQCLIKRHTMKNGGGGWRPLGKVNGHPHMLAPHQIGGRVGTGEGLKRSFTV
jgi:hypothetical protein